MSLLPYSSVYTLVSLPIRLKRHVTVLSLINWASFETDFLRTYQWSSFMWLYYASYLLRMSQNVVSKGLVLTLDASWIALKIYYTSRSKDWRWTLMSSSLFKKQKLSWSRSSTFIYPPLCDFSYCMRSGHAISKAQQSWNNSSEWVQ